MQPPTTAELEREILLQRISGIHSEVGADSVQVYDLLCAFPDQRAPHHHESSHELHGTIWDVLIPSSGFEIN